MVSDGTCSFNLGGLQADLKGVPPTPRKEKVYTFCLWLLTEAEDMQKIPDHPRYKSVSPEPWVPQEARPVAGAVGAYTLGKVQVVRSIWVNFN